MFPPNNNSNKIKTIIENSKSFAILLDKNPEEYEFLSAEALRGALNIKNRLALVPSLGETTAHLKEKWQTILQAETNPSFPQRTAIKLPKKDYNIEQVSYKEEGEHLSFIITSKNGCQISKEGIFVEKIPPEVSAVFCLFEDKEKITEFQGSMQLPENEKIIFISPNEKTLTEKIFGIIKILDENLISNENISTLLLAALSIETDNFSKRTTKDTLSLGSMLLENKASQENVLKILKKENTSSFTQILGRALARTYADNSLDISWSFLNYKDFQKTNNTPPSSLVLYSILKKIRKFVDQSICILIWQSTNGIMATLVANKHDDKKRLFLLAEKMQIKMQSHFFAVGPFKNFSLAEAHMREVIKGVK
ncbi:hypothetical protein KKA27_03555 [Patescibacteria group bacterium]|nr:hypothetical protein [Patescibacteria group bacterium]